MLAIELLISEYKQFSEQYIALALSIESSEIENLDIEYNYILLCINNALYKLMEYQKFLPQSLKYIVVIAMNLTLRWQ